jgi:hypothetical protein
MKSNRVLKAHFVALLTALVLSASAGAAENLTDALEIVRATYRADRQALLAENLHLTESESAAFWPLYRSYRADVDKIGDGLVKLVLEYGDYVDVHSDVPEKRAQAMLKQYSALEQKLASTRAGYLKRAARLLPATKVLRWAQLENRMDLVLRLQMASAVPLVPASESKP